MKSDLLTCLEFWFSILVLTSGWRVKSGAKYSKYSANRHMEKSGCMYIGSVDLNRGKFWQPIPYHIKWLCSNELAPRARTISPLTNMPIHCELFIVQWIIRAKMYRRTHDISRFGTCKLQISKFGPTLDPPNMTRGCSEGWGDCIQPLQSSECLFQTLKKCFNAF